MCEVLLLLLLVIIPARVDRTRVAGLVAEIVALGGSFRDIEKRREQLQINGSDDQGGLIDWLNSLIFFFLNKSCVHESDQELSATSISGAQVSSPRKFHHRKSQK
jgi:hypothetical protein